MISAKELASLLELFKDDDKPLEAVSASFHKAFARSEHFRLACAMCAMLVDGLLAAPAHRLIAYFLLRDMYSAEPLAAQPFLPFLVEQLGRERDGSNAQVEHNLLCLLLAEPPHKDVPKRSALEIRASLAAGEPLPAPNLRAVQVAFAERDQHIPALRRKGIHATVRAPAAEGEGDAETLADAARDSKLDALSARELSCSSFEPAFARPPPPLLGAGEDEVLWLSPCAEGTMLLWDHSMCTDNVKSSEVRELMSKAFKGPLVPQQQQQVLSELESDAKLVYHCGLTPKRLPDLVENNPVIAIEVLLKLMSSSQITDYFSVLVNMDISLHSMEVRAHPNPHPHRACPWRSPLAL